MQMPPPSVCLIIPCVPPHLPHLASCLASVGAGTVLPDRIVVALSNMPSLAPDKYARLQEALGHSCPLEVLCTERTCFAAENRNRAARHCTEEVLSFMDADDECHPERLAVVLDMLQRHQADVVLHSYQSQHTSHSLSDKREIAPEALAERERNDRAAVHLSGDLPVHHAHITLKRATYWAVGGQREGAECRRTEDSHFVRDLFAHRARVAFTYRPLSIYHLHLSSG